MGPYGDVKNNLSELLSIPCTHTCTIKILKLRIHKIQLLSKELVIGLRISLV